MSTATLTKPQRRRKTRATKRSPRHATRSGRHIADAVHRRARALLQAEIDFVLVMSVNPGFGGQQFIASSVGKVRRLQALIGPGEVDISVDGGVCADNAGALVKAGATTLVAGSSVFGSTDRAAAVVRLRQATFGGNRE